MEILVDTLIATWVPAWQKRAKRRVILAPRFYFFDIAIVNDLARRSRLEAGSAAFGAAFEHLIFQELRAHASYAGGGYSIAYWHTASGIEVDFILGDAEVAIEVKSTDRPTSDDRRGLRAWKEEHPTSRCILVARVARGQLTEDGVEVLPWAEFLERLWSDEILVL